MRIRQIAVTSALGVAAVGVAFGAFSIPVGADTPRVSGVSTALVASPAAAGVIPTTDIEPGTPRTWNPTSLTATPVTGLCSATNTSFIIYNLSAAKATVIYGTVTRTVLGILPPRRGAAVCIIGSAGAKAVYHIKGSTSKLVVTLT